MRALSHRSIASGVFAALVAVAALGISATVGSAQQAPQRASAAKVADPALHERIALATELLEVTGTMKQFDVAIDTMIGMQRTMAVSGSPELRKDLDEVLEKLRVRMQARKQELLPPLAAAYAERFSAGELRDLLAFYQTPTGRRLIAEMPELMMQSMRVGAAWGQRIGQELDRDLRAEMLKRGHKI